MIQEFSCFADLHIEERLTGREFIEIKEIPVNILPPKYEVSRSIALLTGSPYVHCPILMYFLAVLKSDLNKQSIPFFSV